MYTFDLKFLDGKTRIQSIVYHNKAHGVKEVVSKFVLPPKASIKAIDHILVNHHRPEHLSISMGVIDDGKIIPIGLAYVRAFVNKKNG